MKYIMKKRQYGLLSEQEEEILTIPYDHFNGDWDMLQIFLKRRKNPPYRISGDLDLFDSPIESLGNLKSVGGDLDLSLANIRSLGDLESVYGDLDLSNSKIESLGNLKSVGGNLNLNGTPLFNKPEEEIRSMVNVEGIIAVKDYYLNIIDDIIGYIDVVMDSDDFPDSIPCDEGFDVFLHELAIEIIIIYGYEELSDDGDYNDALLTNPIVDDFGIDRFKDILLQRHGDRILDYYYEICDDAN